MAIVATPPNVDADPKMDSSSIDDDDDDHSDSNSDSSSSSSIDSIASSGSDSDCGSRSNEHDVLDCWRGDTIGMRTDDNPAAAAIATARVVTTDAHHDHPQDDDEEKELNSVLQKIFKCVARNPWIFLVTSILITVALSAVGVIIGEFAVEVESRGKRNYTVDALQRSNV